MIAELYVKVDESILLSLKKGKEEFAKEMLFNNALLLYRRNRLSLGKAAQLAGYDRIDFIRKLQEEGEPIFDYDDATVGEMIEQSQKALQ